MATAGDANVYRSAFPKGKDGYVPLRFPHFVGAITGGTTAVLRAMRLPFACYIREVVAVMMAWTDADFDAYIRVFDDSYTSTPGDAGSRFAVGTSAPAGYVLNTTSPGTIAVARLVPGTAVLNQTLIWPAGAVMFAEYKPGDAGDSITDLGIELLVEPAY